MNIPNFPENKDVIHHLNKITGLVFASYDDYHERSDYFYAPVVKDGECIAELTVSYDLRGRNWVCWIKVPVRDIEIGGLCKDVEGAITSVLNQLHATSTKLSKIDAELSFLRESVSDLARALSK